MEELEKLTQSILINDCPVKKVSHLLSSFEVSDINMESVEDTINILEMHEAEIRKLRQALSIKLGNHKIEKITQNLRKRKTS